MDKALSISDEEVITRIYLVRGKRVMIDRELAGMYGVKTNMLNQAVKRNKKRFPEDFMFQMTNKELNEWKSQVSITSKEKMGLRKLPFCFTEQGVAMLSSVLSSEIAIEVNIRIIRVFTRMREFLLTHKGILLKVDELEKRVLRQEGKLHKHSREMRIVFAALKELLEPRREPVRKIGFRQN